MEDATTQGQFQVFLEFFREITQDVTSALYYGGILIGFIVFPLYAVFLIRQRLRGRLEHLLGEIVEWDPWLWQSVAGRHGDMWRKGEPIRWLEQLDRWFLRYHGLRLAFGMPDLDAKRIQATRALLSVLLERFHEIADLPEDDRARLRTAADNIARHARDPLAVKLVARMDAPVRPEDPVRTWCPRIREVKTWESFLQAIDLPSHLGPPEAASHAHWSPDLLIPALLLYCDADGNFRNALGAFLDASFHRDGVALRSQVIRVDRATGAKSDLLRRVRDRIEPSLRLERFRKMPAWNKFVAAFGRTPFQSIGAAPDDPWPILRAAYRKKMFAVHPDRSDAHDATARAKEIALSWEVIQALRKHRLLKV